jgi:hypothetical protein
MKSVSLVSRLGLKLTARVVQVLEEVAHPHIVVYFPIWSRPFHLMHWLPPYQPWPLHRTF